MVILKQPVADKLLLKSNIMLNESLLMNYYYMSLNSHGMWKAHTGLLQCVPLVTSPMANVACGIAKHTEAQCFKGML